MKWPWHRRNVGPSRWARAARDGAAKRLEVAEARWPEVRELADWSRERREANHLTQLFYDIREGRS